MVSSEDHKIVMVRRNVSLGSLRKCRNPISSGNHLGHSTAFPLSLSQLSIMNLLELEGAMNSSLNPQCYHGWTCESGIDCTF